MREIFPNGQKRQGHCALGARWRRSPRAPRGGAKVGPAPWCSSEEEAATKKPPPVPCMALLRTRNVRWAPQVRGSDPTTMVGLQAPDSLLAPRGYSIGSSKVSPLSRTPQRSVSSLPITHPYSSPALLSPQGGAFKHRLPWGFLHWRRRHRRASSDPFARLPRWHQRQERRRTRGRGAASRSQSYFQSRSAVPELFESRGFLGDENTTVRVALADRR